MATTTFQFQLDDANLLRLSNALEHPKSGFVYDASSGLTKAQQKKLFIRSFIKHKIANEIVFNVERQIAIEAEPADTAAEQAKRWAEPTITDSEI